MDIWRLAVSVYTHALSNGLEEPQAGAAVLTLCDAYLSTLAGYVGNEKALTYELTPETATGALKKFLTKVKDKASHHHQLKKFTEVVDGQRRLLRNDKTSLVNVSAKKEEELRRALSAFEYGATMMKIGWHARLWDASDGGGEFKVLDVARRVGSGMGSYGVGRYYVLLSGVKEDVEEYADGTDVALGVILDVKFEPTPVAASVFNTFDAAWRVRSAANPPRIARGAAIVHGRPSLRARAQVPQALPQPRGTRSLCAARAHVVHRPVRRLGDHQRLVLRRPPALALEGGLQPLGPHVLPRVHQLCRAGGGGHGDLARARLGREVTRHLQGDRHDGAEQGERQGHMEHGRHPHRSRVPQASGARLRVLQGVL